ncbi:hypothetical protein MUK42_33326 [Musa troglodytarum]|uniref:Uncharacterized protein n=1 Tax=Musa troglodytarum TaxID=320322 RepID=A0A9E7EYA3_9LILI|nr:hypothetical protein MUK42_33326 [Musa troglodytarum]
MEVTNAGRVDSVSKVSSTRVSHLGRSKSASDRNLELTKSGKSHCIARYRTECKGSHNILKILKSHGSQSSYNQDSSESARHTTLNNAFASRKLVFCLRRRLVELAVLLSPGHRHFSAQPVSAHNSGMASPVHLSCGTRKHTSLILSSFCSSKKFRFQPHQVLSSIEDAGLTNILLKLKVRHDLLSRENMNLYVGNDFAYPMKIYRMQQHEIKRNCQPLGGVISHELRNIIFISVQAEYPKRWSDAWLLYIDGCVLTHLKSLVNCILLLKIIYQCCPSSKRCYKGTGMA